MSLLHQPLSSPHRRIRVWACVLDLWPSALSAAPRLSLHPNPRHRPSQAPPLVLQARKIPPPRSRSLRKSTLPRALPRPRARQRVLLGSRGSPPSSAHPPESEAPPRLVFAAPEPAQQQRPLGSGHPKNAGRVW